MYNAGFKRFSAFAGGYLPFGGSGWWPPGQAALNNTMDVDDPSGEANGKAGCMVQSVMDDAHLHPQDIAAIRESLNTQLGLPINPASSYSPFNIDSEMLDLATSPIVAPEDLVLLHDCSPCPGSTITILRAADMTNIAQAIVSESTSFATKIPPGWRWGVGAQAHVPARTRSKVSSIKVGNRYAALWKAETAPVVGSEIAIRDGMNSWVATATVVDNGNPTLRRGYYPRLVFLASTICNVSFIVAGSPMVVDVGTMPVAPSILMLVDTPIHAVTPTPASEDIVMQECSGETPFLNADVRKPGFAAEVKPALGKRKCFEEDAYPTDDDKEYNGDMEDSPKARKRSRKALGNYDDDSHSPPDNTGSKTITMPALPVNPAHFMLRQGSSGAAAVPPAPGSVSIISPSRTCLPTLPTSPADFFLFRGLTRTPPVPPASQPPSAPPTTSRLRSPLGPLEDNHARYTATKGMGMDKVAEQEPFNVDQSSPKSKSLKRCDGSGLVDRTSSSSGKAKENRTEPYKKPKPEASGSGSPYSERKGISQEKSGQLDQPQFGSHQVNLPNGSKKLKGTHGFKLKGTDGRVVLRSNDIVGGKTLHMLSEQPPTPKWTEADGFPEDWRLI